MAVNEASDDAIVAIGLRKCFGPLEAVAGIDFTVRRGECFGFLGPNGAGKSTTMRMIYRAIPLGGGTLRILGFEVGDGTNDRAIKSRMGVVPQEYNLDEQLSAREILRVFARFYGFRSAAAAARVDELLRFVGLQDRGDVKVVTLSGGQKRRVQIARGLIGCPEVLVLDEPTTGLDPQARNALWQRLVDLKRQATTLVLTTHYMDEAEKLCDRLVIMEQGRIVASGSPAELIRTHVAPHAVELRVDDDAEAERILGRYAVQTTGAGRIADRVILHTHEGENLLAAIVRDIPDIWAALRPANLEDVFLAITGHGLEGG